MFCCQCGKEITEEIKYCPNCGALQSDTENPTEDEIFAKVSLCEINITPIKIRGTIYIYVDDIMYIYPVKGHKSVVARVPPGTHWVYASPYKNSNPRKKIQSMGNTAGNIGGSGILGGFGAIIGFSAWLSSKMTVGLMGESKDSCMVTCRENRQTNVKITMSMFGNFIVREVI